LVFLTFLHAKSHIHTDRLNFREEIISEQSGGAAVAVPSGGRRAPDPEASHERRAKVLPVVFPPKAHAVRAGPENRDFMLRFRSAVPLARAEGAGSQTGFTEKKTKKKNKQKASASAAVPDEVDESCPRLQPADIPRVRLFLCHENDVKDGRLPQIHVEVDPCVNLSVAILNLQNISRSSKLVPAKPHTGHQWYELNTHFMSCTFSRAI
jgi:hypothetical protein